MLGDYYVKERDSHALKQSANAWRSLFGICNETCADIVWCVEIGLAERFPQFALVPRADLDMHDSRARTYYNPPRIEIRQSIYYAASCGDPEARYVLAHELGHLTQHSDLPKSLLATEQIQAKLKTMSAEWQADEFAFYFLTPEHVARDYQSIGDLITWLKIPTWLAERAMKEYRLGRK